LVIRSRTYALAYHDETLDHLLSFVAGKACI
jgi:hypothetical protein